MSGDKDRSVVVVDDESIVALDLSERLVRMGFDVLGTASNGEAALDLAARLQPDLVLMDIRLPGRLDGIDVATVLRAEWDIPCVYLTAHADDETLERAKYTEPYGYLVKPFDDRSLVAVLETAIHRRQAEQLRRRAEHQNSEAQARLAAILEHSHDGIVSVDAEQTIVVYNRGAAQLFGYTPEEVMGQPLSVLLPPEAEDHANNVRRFAAGAESGRRMGSRRFIPARRRDGSAFDAEISLSRLDLGKTHLLTAFVRDVTEIRALEHRVRHSQKMEALYRLAGSIAHDFNNVLAAIMGQAQLALMRQGEAREQAIGHVVSSARRGASLAKQLLLFSRKDRPRPRPLSLRHELNALMPMLTQLAGDGIRLDLRIDADTTVMGDSGLLGQVIMNLVSNACDASRGQGVVSLRLCADPKGEVAAIEVEDHGAGISESLQDRVFEPFFTTKEVGRGTGLGLATVHSIVQEMGGTISFQTQLGVGTTFRIELIPAPVLEISEDAAGSQGAAASPDRGRAARVLVVDDDPDVRRVVADTLRELGHEVHEAAGAGAALAMCERDREPFDLVITDVAMPYVSGPELVRHIERGSGRTAAIFITGNAGEHVAKIEATKSPHTMLDKPFTVERLASAVASLLDSRRT